MYEYPAQLPAACPLAALVFVRGQQRLFNDINTENVRLVLEAKCNRFLFRMPVFKINLNSAHQM